VRFVFSRMNSRTKMRPHTESDKFTLDTPIYTHDHAIRNAAPNSRRRT
jgi:hypothetical protein